MFCPCVDRAPMLTGRELLCIVNIVYLLTFFVKFNYVPKISSVNRSSLNTARQRQSVFAWWKTSSCDIFANMSAKRSHDDVVDHVNCIDGLCSGMIYPHYWLHCECSPYTLPVLWDGTEPKNGWSISCSETNHKKTARSNLGTGRIAGGNTFF